MPFILILFFVAGLYYGANLIFVASFTLKVHEADLFCIISWGFCFLQRFDLCGDAVKACSLAPLVEDLDLQTFKWWICAGKNALHSSLAGMTRVVCCLSAQCLLLNFVSADCRKWLSSNKLFNFTYLLPHYHIAKYEVMGKVGDWWGNRHVKRKL